MWISNLLPIISQVLKLIIFPNLFSSLFTEKRVFDVPSVLLFVHGLPGVAIGRCGRSHNTIPHKVHKDLRARPKPPVASTMASTGRPTVWLTTGLIRAYYNS